MNQELKEKLHYYLPHGLKVLRPDNRTILDIIGWENDETLYTREPNNDRSICGFDGCRPFMRPLSSLTKEIVLSNYNDGKPFVPNKIIKKISTNPEYYESHVHPYLIFTYLITKGNNHLPFWVCELLFQWHFWIGDQSLFDTGEIIRIEE